MVEQPKTTSSKGDEAELLRDVEDLRRMFLEVDEPHEDPPFRISLRCVNGGADDLCYLTRDVHAKTCKEALRIFFTGSP